MMVVTGGSGFLGRHVLRAGSEADWELAAPASTVVDITHRGAVLDQLPAWKPTVIVHLAYRKDVRTIVHGSANVAEAAAACGARFVHLSTDVVFTGRSRPYVESDPTEAMSGYGGWKAQAEAAVTAAVPGAVLMRTSLLYGTGILGPCQRDVQRAADGRSAMTFYTDEVRCPVHAGDVAAAVLAVAERADVAGPLHVAGPQPISRYDLALALGRAMGYPSDAIVPGSAAGTGRGASTIVLDSSAAAGLGIHCRPIEAALR
jgi:dTDP-4-dehydrorhamnose reductase